MNSIEGVTDKLKKMNDNQISNKKKGTETVPRNLVRINQWKVQDKNKTLTSR